jgi:hypothetical protein
MSAKMGRIYRKQNTQRHHRANTHYNFVRVETEDGKTEMLLALTDKELQRAQERAEKNPEDCPQASFLQDMLD